MSAVKKIGIGRENFFTNKDMKTSLVIGMVF